MHEQHLLAVCDCLRRHAPADCWQKSETARIGSFPCLLKLPVSAWSDKHSSGHGCILMGRYSFDVSPRLCGEVDLSKTVIL